MSACLVCQEVRGVIPVPGGFLQSSGSSVALHVPPLDHRDVYLGHLLVMPRRHVPDFAGLEESEAAEIGVAISRWSRALATFGADRVYVATIGHGSDHLHVHLVPRWPETPSEIPWHSVDEWSGARRADFDGAAQFAGALLAEADLH
jgi:diadenosine tetraphosphate (Ap4A) HIT family hydrolase